MPITIRPFVPGPQDYAALAGVYNAVYTHAPRTVDDFREQDDTSAGVGIHARWVAESGGVVVGYAAGWQRHFSQAQSQLHIDLCVLPACRRQKLGSTLYARLLTLAQGNDLRKMRIEAHAYLPDGLRFLEAHGFREVLRLQPSRLDVARFDPGPYQGLLNRVTADGITIQSLIDLADDPDRDRKTYALEGALFRDLPGSGHKPRIAFAQWVQNEIENPLLPLDGYLIALDGPDYIGMTHVWRNRYDDTLGIGMTGVLRPYRRRGIGLALKVKSILWAQADGASALITQNDSGNTGMLAINRQLGFKPQPAVMAYEKVLAV